MSTVRFPLALFCGLLFTLGVFTVLFRFVDGPISTPNVSEIIDRVSTPLRPRPPPPPPVHPLEIEPPKLIPQPGRGLGLHVVDPPIDNRLPELPQLGQLRIETLRGGLPTAGTDRETIPIVQIAPDYPPRALASQTEGWVQVQFTISAAGTVKDATVVAAEPRGVFDDAALKAIARWRYNPKVEGGVAVERVGLQTIIRFQLDRP